MTLRGRERGSKRKISFSTLTFEGEEIRQNSKKNINRARLGLQLSSLARGLKVKIQGGAGPGRYSEGGSWPMRRCSFFKISPWVLRFRPSVRHESFSTRRALFGAHTTLGPISSPSEVRPPRPDPRPRVRKQGVVGEGGSNSVGPCNSNANFYGESHEVPSRFGVENGIRVASFTWKKKTSNVVYRVRTLGSQGTVRPGYLGQFSRSDLGS